MQGDVREQLQASLGSAYTVERELGGGGMSRVFIAQDASLDRKVVFKVLDPELAAAVYLDRFHREIKLAARLQHPHIVPLLSAGEAGGLPYFTMPFVDGESLRARLTTGEDFTISGATRLLREVASALAYAHEAGIVHRDIKPENILLSHDSAMVMDFGVAKALSAAAKPAVDALTSPGVVFGTPVYMSPEQGCGDPQTDHRTDIYALGILAYEILAGEAPFAGRPRQSLLAAHLTEKPTNITERRPGIPRALARLVMACLEKDPNDRPQHANEVVALLDTIPADISQTEERGDAHQASIAVLPFANLSADIENEYFSDGITEEILNALQSLPALKVAARTSSFALKGKNLTAREIGEHLKVETVLEGSVRRAGRRVRITVQLVNASDGYRIWSERYDREVEDVFAIQEEIARSIVGKLKLGLTSGENKALARRRTDNFEAYELYLRGRHVWISNRRMDLAIACFEEALKKDPEYALAFHGLAECYASLAGYAVLPPSVAIPPAKAAALRAVELAPEMAETRASLGYIQALEWDRAAAKESFQAAIDLDPRYAVAHAYSAWAFASEGRRVEAAAAARLAQELNPVSEITNGIASLVRYQAREYDEAIREGKRSLELEPTSFVGLFATSVSHAAAGKHEEAIGYAERGVVFSPESTFLLALLGAVNAVAGRKEAAREVLSKLHQWETRGYVSPILFSWIYGNLGDADRAFEMLDRAYEEHSSTIGFGEWLVPLYDPIRDDPRFGKLLEKAGMQSQARVDQQ
jgi:serine/threonine-protein kinase